MDLQLFQVDAFVVHIWSPQELEALAEDLDPVVYHYDYDCQDQTENQAEGQHCHLKRGYHYDYDYYNVHQSQSCQGAGVESVHAQPSDHAQASLVENPYIVLCFVIFTKFKLHLHFS
jgi:hypothetical protein